MKGIGFYTELNLSRASGKWTRASFSFLSSLALLTLVFFRVGETDAQPSSTSQSISIVVQPVSVLAIAGEPTPFAVEELFESSNDGKNGWQTGYSLTTNENNVVLKAELDDAMPPGSQLWIHASSALGVSHGAKRISASPMAAELVTSIGPGLENDREIVYEVRFDDETEIVDNQSRIVTVSLCSLVTQKCSRIEKSITIAAH